MELGFQKQVDRPHGLHTPCPEGAGGGASGAPQPILTGTSFVPIPVDSRQSQMAPLERGSADTKPLPAGARKRVELFDEPGLIAGLNLYSSTAGAFDDDTVEVAMLFAIQATHTLGRVMTQRRLTDAGTTRTTIGRATGVVMERFQMTADRAFELLTRVSRIHDVTLEVLAHQILDDIANPAPRRPLSVPARSSPDVVGSGSGPDRHSLAHCPAVRMPDGLGNLRSRAIPAPRRLSGRASLTDRGAVVS